MRFTILGFVVLLVGVMLMAACGQLIAGRLGGDGDATTIMVGFAVGVVFAAQASGLFLRGRLDALEHKLDALTEAPPRSHSDAALQSTTPSRASTHTSPHHG